MAKARQTTMDKFGIAESLGEIYTMPEVDEVVIKVDEAQEEDIDDPEMFRMAIGRYQMEGLDHMEVGPKLFKYLLKNSKSPYLTYGAPGIKIYLKGTMKDLLKVDKMSGEQYLEYKSKLDAKPE